MSGLSAKLTAEAARLTGLREAVDSEAKQLGELHDLKITDDTLDTVIQEHQAKSGEFERELSDKRAAFERQEEQRLLEATARDGHQLVTTEKDLARMQGAAELTQLAAASQALPVTLMLDDEARLRALLQQALARRRNTSPGDPR